MNYHSLNREFCDIEFIPELNKKGCRANFLPETLFDRAQKYRRHY